MSEKILIAIIGVIGALAGLVPALVTVIYGWTEKRGVFAAKKRAIELAQKRVTFLNTWVETQKLISTEEEFQETKQRIAKELTLLFSSLSDTLSQLELPAKTYKLNWFQKIFLAYRPHGSDAWLLHIFFYMLLGLISFVLVALIASGEYFKGINPATGMYSLPFHFGEILGGCLILLLPWALLWWIARKIDKKGLRKMAEIPSETIKEKSAPV